MDYMDRLGMVLVRFLHHMIGRKLVTMITAKELYNNLRGFLVGRLF